MMELTNALLDVVPFIVLIGGTMGSIYSGLVTPTEAAAVGCLLAMVIAVFWGEFDAGVLWRALQTTIKVCGNILFIVYAAFLFSYAISYAGVGEQITKFLVDLKLSKLEFFLALFVLCTILGCLVESLGMIVVTVPLLYPVLLQYGIDPIWFGVILVLFIEMGQISPPIGINLFVIQRHLEWKAERRGHGHHPVSSDHVCSARPACFVSRTCHVAAFAGGSRTVRPKMFPPPQIIETEVFARMPDKYRRQDADNAWAMVNRRGMPADSFIEGPSFDRDGNLYIVDIPYGRVFRISPVGEFST